MWVMINVPLVTYYLAEHLIWRLFSLYYLWLVHIHHLQDSWGRLKELTLADDQRRLEGLAIELLIVSVSRH